jgi:hypothetical protein
LIVEGLQVFDINELFWMSFCATEKKQVFSVYELNEFNRDSPAVLEFSRQTVNKIDPDTGDHIHALGDQVQFTNTVRSP